MSQKREWIDYCLTFKDAYEDYPFHDSNWAVMRHGVGGKSFAMIFMRQGTVWINVKADPAAGELWRQMYDFVCPAYHMNKRHWISLVITETADETQVRRLITESFESTMPKKR